MEAERRNLDVVDIARRANVPADFVERLIELGAIGRAPFRAAGRDLGRVRLLYAWSQAGFPPETIMRLVDQQALSISFLDTPAVHVPPRLDLSYTEIADQHGAAASLIERLHQAIGFEPPRPQDRGRPLFGGSLDRTAARTLWEVSERETGERFGVEEIVGEVA